MNPTNLLQKLAPVGVAAFSAISVIGIATAPAQAFTLASSLAWEDGTSDFVDEATAAFLGGIGQSFNVTFSPESLGGQAAVSTASGDFNPLFDVPPITLFDVEPPTGTFTLTNFETALPGTQLAADFVLADNDLEFEFEALGGEIVTATLEQGSTFFGVLENDGAVEFLLEEGEWDFTIPGMADQAISSTFEFGQTAFSPNGTYEAQGDVPGTTPVPEPTTILGLLTFGALGLGLKRKKQA